MMTVEVEIELGPLANQERTRHQLAWDYRDKTGGGSCGGGEDESEDAVVLSAVSANAPGSVMVPLVRRAGV